MNISFDKTSIDLLSLVITGSGVFAALAEHYSKELNQTYLGSNPHAIKSNIINSVITKLFLSVAVIGALIQAGSIIFEKQLLHRQFDEQYYLFFLASCILMFVVLKVTVLLAYKLAKRIWYPKAVASKKASFMQIEKAVSGSPTDEVNSSGWA